MREIIQTAAAPAAIGTYSQAVKCGQTVYLSGQIPLDPATGELVTGDVEAQVRRVFENLRAVARAFHHLRIVLEPGGAVALAAALFRDGLSDTCICTASGGNVDPDVFQAALDSTPA